MKRFVLVAALLAFSGAAVAGDPGYWQYNPSSDKWNCVGGSFCEGTPGGGGNGGNGGNGGAGGAGGDATAVGVGIGVGVGFANSTSEANASAIAAQSQTQEQAQTVTTSVGNVNSTVGDVTALGGNASVAEGAVQNTNTNTNTANGGQGGSATIEEGAVTVNIESDALRPQAPVAQTVYKEVKQAPAIGQGSFAIYGCNVGGNAGASGPGWAGFLGIGFTPQQCYDFMLAQAYQSIGEKKAVCDILKNSKAGKRQAKRGIELPECQPEVVVAPVVVPAPEPKTVYVEVPPAKISE